MNFSVTEVSPVSSSLATLLKGSSLEAKTVPPNIAACPFLDKPPQVVEVDHRDQGVKRQTPSSVVNTPDVKRFKGISATMSTFQQTVDRQKNLAQLPKNRLLDVEDSMFNPVQIPLPVRGALGTAPTKIPNFFICQSDRPIQPKQLEPETLRKLLTQPDPKHPTPKNNNSSSVLQNLLVSGHDERTGYKVEVKTGIRVQDRIQTSSASATSLALPSPLLSSTSRKVPRVALTYRSASFSSIPGAQLSARIFQPPPSFLCFPYLFSDSLVLFRFYNFSSLSVIPSY